MILADFVVLGITALRSAFDYNQRLHQSSIEIKS